MESWKSMCGSWIKIKILWALMKYIWIFLGIAIMILKLRPVGTGWAGCVVGLVRRQLPAQLLDSYVLSHATSFLSLLRLITFFSCSDLSDLSKMVGPNWYLSEKNNWSKNARAILGNDSIFRISQKSVIYILYIF